MDEKKLFLARSLIVLGIMAIMVLFVISLVLFDPEGGCAR